MYVLYSDIPKGLKLNNILHIVDSTEYPRIKNKLVHDFIYTRMTIFKPGLTIMTPKALKEYSTIVVHDTPNKDKFWGLISNEHAMRTRLIDIIKSTAGVYVGIGYGGEMIQDTSSYIKGHAGSRVSLLSTPLLGTLNKRVLLNYRRAITTRSLLLDYSRNTDFYCFPPGTGYDSKTKGIIGTGIYLYRDGKEYYVTPNTTVSNHMHNNKDLLDKLTEEEGRLVFTGMAPVVTWELVKW